MKSFESYIFLVEYHEALSWGIYELSIITRQKIMDRKWRFWSLFSVLE